MSAAAWLLMIDDDPDDFEILRHSLSALDTGPRLKFAASGYEGLDLLEQTCRYETCPALILLDLNMPRMSGTETLQRIHNHPQFRHIPVAILSTSVNPLERQKCLELGATNYFVKPASGQEAVTLAKTLLPYLGS